MSGRIIQFGTSRFLQAHVALFVHEARASGQDAGPIAVVQVSGSPARASRVAAFGRSEGYPVIIQGLENGQKVDRHVTVTSIDRGLSAVSDWAALTALFVGDAAFVVSNTGDAGYEIADVDRAPALLDGRVPASFPGKLTALLHSRWQDNAKPLTVLPCELVNRNGQVLQAAVLELASLALAPEGFIDWLRRDVIWPDTLVDRIVSEPLDPIGAVAEPYAIWVIERRPGLTLPCAHPSIVMADDLEPFERLKLHILNLGHTVLAELWRQSGRPGGETVREILADPTIRARLDAVYAQEVLPGFAMHGMGTQAERYVNDTLGRFLNPFLAHRVADIAQNHAVKVERRIAAFLAWLGDARHPTPVLDEIVARHQNRSAA
ncbi:mannitol dehydrogenase family protein [Pseudoroseomonas globiformis]|uniref:Mannitol dehydrogenase family protein n=1 Tax=Teichococcus globiformis TaxID=2307229 RepID=A0ABV7G093_9PROT